MAVVMLINLMVKGRLRSEIVCVCQRLFWILLRVSGFKSNRIAGKYGTRQFWYFEDSGLVQWVKRRSQGSCSSKDYFLHKRIKAVTYGCHIWLSHMALSDIM
ncbi:hypothetical protein YC2023_101779 [Brassica napus]